MNFDGLNKESNDLKVKIIVDFYNEISNFLINQSIKSFKINYNHNGRFSFFTVTQINGVDLTWHLIGKNFQFDYLIDKMIKADVTEDEFERFIRMIDHEKTLIMLYMHCEKYGQISLGTLSVAGNKDIEMNNIK